MDEKDVWTAKADVYLAHLVHRGRIQVEPLTEPSPDTFWEDYQMRQYKPCLQKRRRQISGGK